MYQSPRRLCSALLLRDAPGLRRTLAPGPRRTLAPPPALRPRPASPRLQAAAASGAARSRPRTGSSMGNGTGRLYSALTKTLNSSAAAQHPEYLVSADPDHLEPIDPKELLEECRAVLHTRPPRHQRDFVDLRTDCPSSHPPIRVMQWNILAQALGEGKDNFVQCPVEALKWEERKCLILEEILAYQPDILCLQEVDHYFDTFQPLLSRLGYQGTFFPKPWSPCLDVEHNNGPDGCALFFLQNRFKLINSTNIRLTAMTLKTNQVAIAQTLECKESGRQFCIAVTHLKARTGWERFRSAQGCDLLQNLQNITQGAKIPLIVCGDFNAEPTEEVYKHFASSSLNLNSAYKLLSPDGQSEPPYTTWKIRTSGECRHTLDYIWYSRHALNVTSALDLLTEEQIGPNRLPSFHYPSDHLSLVCDFSFSEGPDELL
ncbi:LOW QUALITY PROTEIN: nocturnin [Peromyscus leucopus]|uniref:LOW QUALITY PROTEIN: nocturnin n=1 Tax=Peromyscus leucopus TaxID=10041 RepID=UPI0010A0ECC0|nr:LOW QUALITY PROTEIN: nocturnin [Peromyscus leucopus]